MAALENQLLQAGKNCSNERLREEITKLEENKLTYQVAAKEALQKLHAEKLEALAVAAEHERARATAEQEAELAKEMLAQTQMELTVSFNSFQSYCKRETWEIVLSVSSSLFFLLLLPSLDRYLAFCIAHCIAFSTILLFLRIFDYISKTIDIKKLP